MHKIMLFLLKNCKNRQRWGPVPIPPYLRWQRPQTPNGFRQLGVSFHPQTPPNPNPTGLHQFNALLKHTVLQRQRLDKGPYIKDVQTKSRKIDSLSSCPQNVRTCSTSSPLSVQTHHKFRKIRSFLHQKVRTSTPEEPPSPMSKKCPH